jgi:isovaleryl-CoA dehydrogenase
MLLNTVERGNDLRIAFADFGQTVVRPRADRFYELRMLDLESWHDLANADFWRIAIRERDGGHGRSWHHFGAALEGLAAGAGDLGFVLSLIAHAGLLRAVSEFGSASQRARLLEPLMNGAVGATAITEATGGSDVAAIRTSAVRADGGYRLSGEKDHITNAPVADLALVLGRIPELGRRDISIFLVETLRTGVLRGPAERLFGLRTSPTGSLSMDDVELPSDAVLGHEGEGLKLLYNVISFDRMLYGLVAAAYLTPLLDLALQFAAQRTAFKSLLIDHEYMQGRLTDIRLDIEVTRAVSRAALDALVSGRPDASLSCSVAKLIGSESLVSSTRHVMAVLGHRGYMEGETSRCIQDALGTLIAGGTTEMQRKNIFNQMLGEMRDTQEAVR